MNVLKIILATILGAVATFAWNSFSWMFLTLHSDSMRAFENAEGLAPAIAAAAPAHGVYVFPWSDCKNAPDPKAAHAEFMEKAMKGPWIFAVVRPGESPGASMEKSMIQSAATQLAAAFLVALALSATVHRLNYICRVLFVAMLGLFAWVVAWVPSATWWEMPWAHVCPYAVDLLAGWFLAGLVMAALIRPSSS